MSCLPSKRPGLMGGTYPSAAISRSRTRMQSARTLPFATASSLGALPRGRRHSLRRRRPGGTPRASPQHAGPWGLDHLEDRPMFSFDPSEEQKMLIEAAKRYAANDLRPAAHDADESGQLPQPLIDKGWGLGVLQAGMPEAYGGFGDRWA